jgi:transcriptional regulator with XRE-family HTH domain
MRPSPRHTEPDPHREPERLWRQLVGEQLRSIRHDRGETLQSVAEKAAVSKQYLSEIERGYKEPSSEILAAVAASLDTSLLDLTRAVSSSLQDAAPQRPSGRGEFTLAA